MAFGDDFKLIIQRTHSLINNGIYCKMAKQRMHKIQSKSDTMSNDMRYEWERF